MSLYTVIKYICSIIFQGPLNFNIEIIFWIFNGILFGPIIGPLYSILCDTVFTLFTTGIGYWMIEYAIIPPLISLISWLFWKSYKENNKWTIAISLLFVFLLIISSLTVFFFQLFKTDFKYEGISSSKIIPLTVYLLIGFLSITITGFTIFCYVKYKIKKDWKYIKWLYWLTLIIIVVVLFRWIWGPFAYLQYSKRFFSQNINFSKQYPLSLFGIVTKSCLTIPIASMVVIPIINIFSKLKYENEKFY